MSSESQSEILKCHYDRFSSKSYLGYFTEVYEHERFIMTNLNKAFESGTVSGDRILDFSCGPVPHRLGLASKYCQELTFSDFSGPNREVIRNWLNSNVTEPSHKLMFCLVAGLEGFDDVEEGAEIIEERTKSKSTGIITADVHNPSSPLSPPQKLFDMVYSGAVLESACLKHEQYVPALKNLLSVLKPGGFFICSGFTGGDFYNVGGMNLPILNQSEEFIEKSFVEAGLKVIDFKGIVPKRQKIASIDAPNNRSNWRGCFFAITQKQY